MRERVAKAAAKMTMVAVEAKPFLRRRYEPAHPVEGFSTPRWRNQVDLDTRFRRWTPPPLLGLREGTG